uniref:Uncharacterized protein n=1 Tax=Parascaris equorum TaxID=6256 RepID=A0A914S294_PAREQ
MPGGFSRGVLRARSVEDRTNDEAGSGDRELTTNRQRSHEEVIFKASIDLDEEHTASVSRLQETAFFSEYDEPDGDLCVSKTDPYE